MVTGFHRGLLILCLVVSADLGAVGSHFDIENIDDTPKIRDVQYPDWFKVSFLDLAEDLEEAVADGKKGIIVYFGQKHCAYCEALMEVNFGRETDIVEYTRRNFDVIPIDIWSSREVTDMQGRVLTETAYAEREQTNFTPSMIFYDQDGKQALRIRGYYPPYKFRGSLEYVVGGHYNQETLRDYLARAGQLPKMDLGEVNQREFFESPPYALDRSRVPAQKPLAIFFEQRNCHACDILHTGPLSDERTIALLGQFSAVQLDMWSDTSVLTPDGRKITAQQWASELGLFYAPTVVFFDVAGKEVFRIDSVVRLYRLQGVLEYVLAKGYEEVPTFQRWREIQRQRRSAEKDTSQ